MKIVLRNLELLLKWEREKDAFTASDVVIKMLQESIELVKEKIADDLDKELNKHLQGS